MSDDVKYKVEIRKVGDEKCWGGEQEEAGLPFYTGDQKRLLSQSDM